MMTGKQQLTALKYAIAHLSDEIQGIEESIKTAGISDFMKRVLTIKLDELKADFKELDALDDKLRNSIFKRLSKEEWQTVWTNVELREHSGEPDDLDMGIEVSWLDGTNEWVLNAGDEMLEDGFTSEAKAHDRLNFVQNNFIEIS